MEFFLFVTGGLTLQIFCLYLQLLRRSHLLEEQLQIQQHLIAQAFADLHNQPLQTLAFLLRTLPSQEVSKSQLIEHLEVIYKTMQAIAQNLLDSQEDDNSFLK